MKNPILVSAIVMIASRAGQAQAVSFGVKGGMVMSDLTAFRDESRPYAVGASIEIRLPANFAIEIDALYRRLGDSTGFTYLFSGALNSSFNRDRGNAWEFPFLGKYYFRHDSPWQPFVGTGWALGETWFHSDTSSAITNSDGAVQTYKYHLNYADGPEVGAVVTAGLRFHRGRFAFAPEARFTRWGGSNHDRNPRNEGGILLGISF